MINIDWLNISQNHPSVMDENGVFHAPLPVVCSGVVGKFTDQSIKDFLQTKSDDYTEFLDIVEDASEWATASRVIHQGSYCSSLWLGSDGNRIEFRGNPARHNRPDNVFTGTIDHALACANAITAEYGLPPFSPGEYTERRDQDGNLKSSYTGATVSMIHANQKIISGSPEALEEVLRWSHYQSMPNVHTRPQENGTVWGSKKSHRKMIKLYGKAREMLAHAKEHGRTKAEVLADPVYQYCHENGVLCLELEARRSLLEDRHMRYLAQITQEKIEKLFAEEAMLLFSRGHKISTDFDLSYMDVPAGAMAAAADWLKGGDPFKILKATKQATAYRYANALKAYGIDITQPLDKDNPCPPPIVRLIDVHPVTQVPDWYWAHQARMTAEASNSDPIEAAA